MLEKLHFKKKIKVLPLENYDFLKPQSLFCRRQFNAKKWVRKAAKKTIVIDNSKYFRMENIPLVVAEVNSDQQKA